METNVCGMRKIPNSNYIRVGGDNVGTDIYISLEDRTTLITNLVRFIEDIPKHNLYQEVSAEDNAKLNQFQKRWRGERDLKMDEEILRINNLIHICTIPEYHVYARWIDDDKKILNLMFSGNIMKYTNIFTVDDCKGLDLIRELEKEICCK